MALTTDQSALLQTTIDNLNRSIEINNQVLELMKSIGNTGIVDIATHNTDKTAHSEGFNNLLALLRITCSPNSAGPDAVGSMGGTRIQHSLISGISQLVNRFNLWGA